MSKKRKAQRRKDRLARKAKRTKDRSCPRCGVISESKIHTPALRETLIVCSQCTTPKRKEVHREDLHKGEGPATDASR